MTALRPSHSFPSRTVWLVLLLAALFGRGFIADGYMPDFTPGKTAAIAICDGGTGLGHRMPAGDNTGGHAPSGPMHGPMHCPYMALALQTPVPPVVFAAVAPPALLFSAPMPASWTQARYRGAASPRGPPSFS